MVLVREQIQLQNESLITKALSEDYDIHEGIDSLVTLNSLGIDSLMAADMAFTFSKVLNPPFDDVAKFMQFILSPSTKVADLYKLLLHKLENERLLENPIENGSSESKPIKISIETRSRFMSVEKWCWNSSRCIDASPVMCDK